MIATHCLSEHQLDEFASGKCPADQFDQILAHLEECASCQSKTLDRETPPDAFASLLRIQPGPLPGDRSSRIGSAGIAEDPIIAEPDCGAALLNASSLSASMRMDGVMPPVESLGPYRLIRPLGRGGMGAVYLAEHSRLKKRCAIKLLPRERGFDAAWLLRFEREMQAVASLDHPGIVAATDAGDVDGWHYLVMEYLDGLDLAAIVRRVGRLPVGVAAQIMAKVTRALAAIHDAGLIHRDVKPSNIMLTRDGQVKLLDLGLVLDGQSAADMRLTTVGHVIGTLVYAAPEQLDNQSTLDARTDLYGVGATLFQLITGETAHQSDRGIAPLVIDKTSGVPKSLCEIQPNVDPSMNAFVSQLMHQDPDQRPRDTNEVAARLLQFATEESLASLVRRAIRITDSSDSLEATVWPTAAPSQPPPPKHIWIAWGLGGLAACLLAIIVITINTKDRKIVVTADGDDVQVNIEDADSTESEVRSPVDQRVYQGKPMSHWTRSILIERDSKTQGEAMNAIARLADETDVDAAQQILIAARRFGGWIMGGDDPSIQFMNQFFEPFELMMPRPGVSAITRELAQADPESTAACLWVLQRSPHFATLAETHPELAGKLHDVMKERLRTDPLWASPESSSQPSGMTKDAMRIDSIQLAVSLGRSLDDEPGLRRWIDYRIASFNPPPPINGRLDDLFEGSKPFAPKLPHLNVWESHVANYFRIKLSVPLAVHSWLNVDTHDRMSETVKNSLRLERNKLYLQLLREFPTEVADESWFWLNQPVISDGGLTSLVGPAVRIHDNEDLWKNAMPLISQHTSRKEDVVFPTLGSFNPEGVIANRRYGTASVGETLSKEMQQVLIDSLQQAMKLQSEEATDAEAQDDHREMDPPELR